jgi:hypothetical protein
MRMAAGGMDGWASGMGNCFLLRHSEDDSIE